MTRSRYFSPWRKAFAAICMTGTIFTAENGKQAADIIDARFIDVVVTDIRMPTMDGYELLLYIRKTKPYLPVIVMTADWIPELESRLIPLGAVSVHEKTF